MKKIDCKRCGTCCVKGGPILHGDDLPLISKKIIRPDQLIVIRLGEPAYNPITDAVEQTSCEMLKIQGKAGNWECLFYDGAQKSCSIHNDRPLECRLLQCQDPTDLLDVAGKDCLRRHDIISHDDPAISYIEAFDEYSWEKLSTVLATLNPQSIREAEKILCTDLLLRQQAVSLLHLSLPQEFFYFGRPMFQSFSQPGIQLTIEKGMPCLKLI